MDTYHIFPKAVLSLRVVSKCTNSVFLHAFYRSNLFSNTIANPIPNVSSDRKGPRSGMITMPLSFSYLRICFTWLKFDKTVDVCLDRNESKFAIWGTQRKVQCRGYCKCPRLSRFANARGEESTHWTQR